MIRVFSLSWRETLGLLALGLALGGLAGCSYEPPQFRANMVFTEVAENKADINLTYDQEQAVANVLTALFGTPDDPHVPAVDDAALNKLLDEKQLQRAAGPVGRDASGQQHGLYREHCAHCHGVTGDGQGPTGVYLNPYPRDYRKGLYKFKSTPKGERPTHADLKRTLLEGIPGTAMPSFKLLHDDQVEALIGYVKYLSLRGEVEAKLIDYTLGDEVETEDEVILDPAWREKQPEKFAARLAAIKEIVTKQYTSWSNAEKLSVEIPKRPEHKSAEELAESIRKGNDLFHGSIAICIKCHGETALGDGQITDYDDWTKEWLDTKDPKTRAESLARGLAAGALPPRNIIPRNLRQANLRGGHRPIDLYWRIVNGIDGTPMPAANMRKPTDAPTEPKLTPEDVWHIVDYVQSLPYEPLSQREYLIENVRDDKF